MGSALGQWQGGCIHSILLCLSDICLCVPFVLRGDLRELDPTPEHVSHLAPPHKRGGFACGTKGEQRGC